jgi:hypothetical protein
MVQTNEIYIVNHGLIIIDYPHKLHILPHKTPHKMCKKRFRVFKLSKLNKNTHLEENYNLYLKGYI